MVATRTGTRVEPLEEEESDEQTSEEVISQTSPIQTRSSAKKVGKIGENSTREHKSAVTSRSTIKSDLVINSTPITTRSRHRSEQSDADVSEAESTASNASTRRSRSRPSLGQITDSTRKLRSHRSALITEPIIESQEDAESSAAESICSSVSTTARKKPPGTAQRSVLARSRKSHLRSEPASDDSDAESNSSVSGVRTIATRSTKSSNAGGLSSLIKEPQKEQTSDAESCCSGFSLQPLARRSSRRNKPNLQSEEIGSEFNKDGTSDEETPKKQDIKSDSRSSVREQNVLSSLRRSSRTRPAISKDVIVISDDEPENSGNESKVLPVEDIKLEDSSCTKCGTTESSVTSSAQSSEIHPEENIADQVVQPSEGPIDEEPPMEKSVVAAERNDAAAETKDDLQSVQESTNMVESKNHLSLIISDDEKSEHDDDDDEEEIEQVAGKPKSKKASIQQRQDVSGDELFVIDTAPGAHSSKKYFLEDDDDVESDADENEEMPCSEEEEDDDENNMELVEEEDDNDEQVVNKGKSRKASKQQLQDILGDGLFVIDTAPGVDASKKYFLEPEDKADQNKADGKGETPGLDEDDEEDFIDKDEDEEDEEETLLNRPKSGFALSSSIDTGIRLKEMGGLYINFDAEKPNPGPSLLKKMKKGNKKLDELLQKSVITTDFEKKESVPPYKESLHKLKKLRKEELDKTSGSGWFDMKAPELTDELKNDLKALKLRSAMDLKHFYKKNDREGFPKYFQVGTVVDNPVDYYHSRIPKKERKRTLVEELLADSEFRRRNKKKYQEIIAEKAARAEGKKNRKKKKFRT